MATLPYMKPAPINCITTKNSCSVGAAILLFIIVSTIPLSAQRGVAPNGYYPPAYRGDTFTGTVIAIDEATDSVTLEYKKGSDSESFPISLEGGCAVPSKTGDPMHVRNIPRGTVLTAFYLGKTDKHDGQKKRIHVAIGIMFLEWHGKPVSEESRVKLYTCGGNTSWSYFRAFPGGSGAAAISPLNIVVPSR